MSDVAWFDFSDLCNKAPSWHFGKLLKFPLWFLERYLFINTFTDSKTTTQALGAADYLAIGRAFHTVFLANIPRLTMQERDQVRRFITLIDSLYECHTKVVCTAELDPIPLFYVSEEERTTSTADEIFAWHRTASCSALAAVCDCLQLSVCFCVSTSLSLALFPSFFNVVFWWKLWPEARKAGRFFLTAPEP